MKATSKLISVVLILAMCLSLFTVSAFADSQTVIPGEIIPNSTGGGIPAGPFGVNRGQQPAQQAQIVESPTFEGSSDAETVTTADTAQAVPGTTDQVTNTVPAIVTVSTAAELAAAAAKGGEIVLANDIAMSEGLTVAANAVIDLNGKALSFENDAAAKGMAITGMGATIKNGMVSAKGSVLASDNGTVEVGFGSVASGVTMNNVNVRFYAPAEWTMFGQGVGLVYGTYNRDVSAYFAGSDKLEVVEQNGVFTVRDKVEVPEAVPAVTENEDAAVSETEQPAAETTEETVNETELTAAGVEETVTEGEQTITEDAQAEIEVEGGEANVEGGEANVEGGEANVEGGEANVEGGEANVEGEEANVEGEEANVEGGEANVEGGEADVEGGEADVEGGEADVEGGEADVEGGEADVEGGEADVEGGEADVEGGEADVEGGEADVEGEDANVEGEQADENALPESDEQQAAENPADDEPADETPVNVVEEKEEEPVTEEEIRTDLDAENAEDPEAVTLTGTDPVTGAVVTITGKNLPADLTVVVKPLSADSIGGLGEDERAILVLDISLVDAEGNEYEPEEHPEVGAVSVQIKHHSLGNLEEDETLALYHVTDDVTKMVGSAEQTGADTLGFATGSFSPFIITVTTGDGTANTGFLGETHHRKVTITNVSGDIYLKNWDGKANQPLVFKIEGGVVPESISVIDPDQVSSGNASIYKSGYMIYDANPVAGTFLPKTYDYTITDSAGNAVDPTKEIPDPVYVRFSSASLANAPTGKWAFVFWFRDTTDAGAQRVYMVQYVTIVPKAVIKALAPVDGFGDFYYNKCSYDPLEIFITADLDIFTIKDSEGKTVVWYDYNTDPKHVHVNTKDFPNKTFNYGDVFQITDYKVSGDLLGISDYWTEDPVSHEFIGGKTLKVYHELLKKLDFGDYTIHIEQKNHEKNNYEYPTGWTNYENPAQADFKLSLLPGIAVADGLDDYIKGKNIWIKFVSCWPIDYDDDGTLAIWIGGQKISKDYYSISNDHQTLWIYRNLLDQLRSNNSYTLTARLWRLNKTNGEREYFYPAQASFNILAAGSTSYKSPKTGDNSNVALWAAVAVLSGGAVVALIPKKKKVKISK